MPSGVCSIILQYEVHKSFLFNRRCFDLFHEVNREYVGMFLHLIGVFLTESFNLVSNIWYVKTMMQNVIGDVPRSVDNDSEVFVLKSF